MSGREVDGKITDPAVLAAHRFLVEQMPKLGLTPSNNSGHVKAVRLHDVENRYLFSWIPNNAHLLFYIRKPALKAAPHLHQSFSATAPEATQNPAGETTFRITNMETAEKVVGWLKAELPSLAKVAP